MIKPTMTSDREIYSTASVLIWEHGDEAELVATLRADDFLGAGDVDGSIAWMRVVRAVKEIQRQERQSGEALH